MYHWMRQLRACCIFALMMLASRSASARNTLVEIEFDDQESGTGELDGHGVLGSSSGGEGPTSNPRIHGRAVRTAMNEGKYGRGLRLFGGDDSVDVELVQVNSGGMTVTFWVRFEGAVNGTVLDLGANGSVRLIGGRFATVDAMGMTRMSAMSAGLDTPGFHHVVLVIPSEVASPATVSVDFVPPVELIYPRSRVTRYERIRIGTGMTAVLDDVVIFNPYFGRDVLDDLFDLNPMQCTRGTGTQCTEFWFPIRPRGYFMDVPVRVKVAWPTVLCTAASPCPLVVTVSAGGSCPDDYDNIDAVQRLVDGRFVVATVDVACRPGECRYSAYPHDTSQLIESVNRVRAHSLVGPMIAPGEYYASAASRGGASVMSWILLESSRPARAFLRSPGGVSALCNTEAFLGGYPDAQCPLLGNPFIRDNFAPTSAAFCAYIDVRGIDKIRMLTSELVSSRGVGLSWGIRPMRGRPPCDEEGGQGCFEMDGGFASAARAFRDRWESLEAAGGRTGFFFENQVEGGCHHTLQTDDAHNLHWNCINCFLRHGRSNMTRECPRCMELPHGAAAPTCVACSTFPVLPPDPLGAVCSGCGTTGIDGGSDGGDCGTDAARVDVADVGGDMPRDIFSDIPSDLRVDPPRDVLSDVPVDIASPDAPSPADVLSPADRVQVDRVAPDVAMIDSGIAPPPNRAPAPGCGCRESIPQSRHCFWFHGLLLAGLVLRRSRKSSNSSSSQ